MHVPDAFCSRVSSIRLAEQLFTFCQLRLACFSPWPQMFMAFCLMVKVRFLGGKLSQGGGQELTEEVNPERKGV